MKIITWVKKIWSDGYQFIAKAFSLKKVDEAMTEDAKTLKNTRREKALEKLHAVSTGLVLVNLAPVKAAIAKAVVLITPFILPAAKIVFVFYIAHLLLRYDVLAKLSDAFSDLMEAIKGVGELFNFAASSTA